MTSEKSYSQSCCYLCLYVCEGVWKKKKDKTSCIKRRRNMICMSKKIELLDITFITC